jgi:catechol 2,3-dioxygenase-like lactoylglutathione lyase family enzyme
MSIKMGLEIISMLVELMEPSVWSTISNDVRTKGSHMRLQLAINVSDLDGAIDFYGRLFATEPLKVRPGYANFAIDNPPLKLVLFENGGEPGSINHLGVETESPTEVVEAERRLSGDGMATTGVADTQCCFAEKTETWVTAPDGIRWEYYVKTGDVEQFENVVVGPADATPCCGPAEQPGGSPSTGCS